MTEDRPGPLARRYRLLSVAGSGGMGTVWRARDELLDRDVAVKEIRLPDGTTGPERAALGRRLLAEARATAALRHPGVVTVHDVLVERGRPWIVMEFHASRSLSRLVDERGPLGVRRTAEIGAAVLSVLRAAHAAGIAHRDVKPGNVLVRDDDGRVLLTDFGLALRAEHDRDEQHDRDAGDGIEGSPAYLPPERVGGLPGGPASDLWSLGATLYAAVEGTSPFLRPHALGSMVAVLLGDYPPPERAGALAPVIEGLLRRDPDERLPADEVARLLDAAARPDEPLVPRPRGPDRPGRPGLRRPRTGAVASVAALAVLTAGLGTWAARWTAVGQGDAAVAADPLVELVPYREMDAYAVRVPAGWRAERRGAVMRWRDGESGRGLRIAPAPGDPLAGLRAAERAAVAEGRRPGYLRVRLGPGPGPRDGAVWEFTWRGAGGGRHVACTRASGYELCFTAPESLWRPDRRLHDRILASFRTGSAPER
ncbi:serine/threonine-protein kinase [Actinomadura algeriensis]|uniref:non-specific serine/threonine protein kinase n=1 Tax=Actinomadura algeriensis TaxID=1679523 RepID=A0ABR9JNF8_9ACTN|nr:serine/threonine-protein kinase [Actinomadura algeriensis]MBE1532082.1 tRNA A-37 threonylcarbamoyl transferase component Bud32 [Actinomadura algeriensis]